MKKLILILGVIYFLVVNVKAEEDLEIASNRVLSEEVTPQDDKVSLEFRSMDILDALKFGFRTFFLWDGSRGINTKPGDIQRSLEKMEKNGAKKVTLLNFNFE